MRSTCHSSLPRQATAISIMGAIRHTATGCPTSIPTAINDLKDLKDPKAPKDLIYNLVGQRLPDETSARGIVIAGRKKLFVK